MTTNERSADFGLIGLGTMGRNLALNIEDSGFSVAVWNRDGALTDAFLAENAERRFVDTRTYAELAAAVEPPRRILLMITAGKPVDLVLDRLVEVLEAGDVVIDGGNTWYQDTRRREERLRKLGLHFIGLGVSGGEDGARYGPSLMPGGDRAAYELVSPVFESIAAKTTAGPCVTHVGADGAGHYVKMVHNGIEYADMQLIAESYDLLRRAYGVKNDELAAIYDAWNGGVLESFLIEITAEIFRHVDAETGAHTVDLVLDQAGQKGTGRWTVQSALELGVPVPSISAALDARGLSARKPQRVAASKLLAGPHFEPSLPKERFVQVLHDGLYAAKICAYAQGFDLIQTASDEYDWGVDLGELARIWTAGCIIRARLLDDLRAAFREDQRPANLLITPRFAPLLVEYVSELRRAVAIGTEAGVPVPALSASLAYFDSYRTEKLPQNLTQAQRDAFGAHTFVRLDAPDGEPVHVDWI
ncbi:MAG: NADP-dependent phosphogluconate dehydrogenase [Planctomycetota bacterium]